MVVQEQEIPVILFLFHLIRFHTKQKINNKKKISCLSDKDERHYILKFKDTPTLICFVLQTMLVGTIEGVRSLLTDNENERASDAMVERYLCAVQGHGGDVEKKASRRLKETLAWWDRENPAAMYCPACYHESYAGHYMHVVCYDMVGRPTIYSCLEHAENKDIEDNRKHIISTFETAIELMGDTASSWNWVLDLHGFRMVDCNPRLAKIFLHLAADHYPERLGNIFLVDAPKIFSGFWSVISPFIDPKTKQKIEFVSTKSAKDEERLCEVFSRHFKECDVTWFLNEIQDNRIKKRGGKYYNYQTFVDAVVASAAASQDEQQEDLFWAPTFLQDIMTNTKGIVPPRIEKMYKG